jgi:hypothetical protein
MTAWIAWLLALPAFAALSLAMERHHEQVCGAPVSRRSPWGWRAVGVVLLVASLAVCLHTWGTSVAIAAWLGLLTLAALPVVLVITYAARRLRWVAGVSLLLGVLGLLML